MLRFDQASTHGEVCNFPLQLAFTREAQLTHVSPKKSSAGQYLLRALSEDSSIILLFFEKFFGGSNV